MPAAVLLVDERDDASAVLAGRLRRMEGIELVGAVRDAEEAARVLMNVRPDVLLLDLHGTHTQDGVLLCRQLHALDDAPLLVLASFLSAEQRERLHAAGAAGCVLKQIDSKQLGDELQRLASAAPDGRTAREGGAE